MENSVQQTMHSELYDSERNKQEDSTPATSQMTPQDNNPVAATPASDSDIDPYKSIIDGRTYLCMFGPSSSDLTMRYVTVRRKTVPLKCGPLKSKAALGPSEYHIELEMSDIEGGSQGRLFHHHHRHRHCHHRRQSHHRSYQSCYCSSIDLSSALSALSLSSSSFKECFSSWEGSVDIGSLVPDTQKSGHMVARCSYCATDITKHLSFKSIGLVGDAVTKKASINRWRLSSEVAREDFSGCTSAISNKSRSRSSAKRKSKAKVKFDMSCVGGDAQGSSSVSLGRNNSNSSTKERAPPQDNVKLVGRIVHVEGDGRCLFRSLVAASDCKLQKCKRDEYGRPEERNDAEDEKWLADDLREKVVSFMNDNLHFYSQLEKELINADQPSSTRYTVFLDRLDHMSRKHTMPGELELNAASAVLEQMIVVLDSNLEVICVYGDERYPESTPLTVRFTRLGEDVGHYDAVVLDSCSDSARSRFHTLISCIMGTLNSFNSKKSVMGGTEMDEDMDINETCANQHDHSITSTDAMKQDTCNNNHGATSSDDGQKLSKNSRIDSKIILYRDVPESVSASTQTSENNCTRRTKKRRRGSRKTRRGGGRGRALRCVKCGSRRRPPRDRNYNRKRSAILRKRPRSPSFDSSRERQRKKRRRVAAPCPARNKKRVGHGRNSRTKRSHRSGPPRVRKRKVARVEARYVLVKPQWREGDDSGGAILGWNVIRPKSPVRLNEIISGPVFCFLCRKKVTKGSSNPNWLRCYLCGRSAHQECAVKESRAWSPGHWDEPYFVCSQCAPH